MQAEVLPEEALLGTRVVYGLLGDSRYAADATYIRSLQPFRDLAPGKIAEFLFRIGLELVAARPKMFSMDQTGELAWEAHLALNHGLEVAEGWPGAFLDVLAIMRERAPGGPAKGLLQSVGAVERWLDLLPPGSGPAVREACAEFRRRAAAQKQEAAQHLRDQRKTAKLPR